MLRIISGLLVLFGVLTGTLSDSWRNPIPHERGGHTIIEGDFHVHSHSGDGALSPFGLVLESRRRGLHTIAITDHNQVFSAKCGRWFSRLIGGPTVLVGEEITAPDFHLIGVGLSNRVTWRQSAAQAIAEVHRQGGVAIAAHPTRRFWEGFNQDVIKELDGAEVMHPLSYTAGNRGEQLRAFYQNAEASGRRLTPVGSSDYHWFTSLGMARTYLFVRDNTEDGVLDALRNGQTVVFDADGREYGKPELVQLLEEHRLSEATRGHNDAGKNAIDLLGRTGAWFGLLGLVLLGRRKTRRQP
jgi:PHP domain